MTKTAQEVEQEVEATRADLDQTVEALKDKMTPRNILDDVTHSLGASGEQVAYRLLDEVKRNPVPLALIGAGLAMMVMSRNRGHEPSFDAYGDAYGDGMAQTRRTNGSGALHAAGERVSETVHSAKEGLASAAGTARQRAAQYGDRARQGVAGAWENEPLIIGAIGLAVGVAVGAALPPTPAENRYVGAMRDKVVDRTKDVAQQRLHQAKEVAGAAYTSAKEEFGRHEQGDGESMADAAARAAKAGAQGARQTLEQGRQH